jgi:cathepsin B
MSKFLSYYLDSDQKNELFNKLPNNLKQKIKDRPLQTFLSLPRYLETSTIHNIQWIEGQTTHTNEFPLKMIHKKDFKLPKNFDGPNVWKDLLTPIHQQGKCGSCWAFASTSTLSDRFNILSTGKIFIILSPSRLVFCDWQGLREQIPHPEIGDPFIPTDQGCHGPICNKSDEHSSLAFTTFVASINGSCYGNSLTDAWRFLYLFGSVSMDCLPYDFTFQDLISDKIKIANLKGNIGDNYLYQLPNERVIGQELSKQADYLKFSLSNFKDGESFPSCQDVSGSLFDMCINYFKNAPKSYSQGSPARFWRCSTFYSVPGTPFQKSDYENIMYEIYKYGPVTSGFNVFPDFYSFDPKKEIYKWNNIQPQIGGHAVEIVGWGEENNIKFWWIKNSWGKDWGINGYFKMIRGINNCNIESNVITGIPDFFTGIDNNHILNFLYKNGLSGEMTPKYIIERKMIDYGTPNHQTGGIDPTTGFTRRCMNYYIGVDYSSPINEKIKLNKYAAEIGNINNYKNNNYKNNNYKNNNHKNNYIFIFIMIIIIILFFSITLFYKYKYNL